MLRGRDRLDVQGREARRRGDRGFSLVELLVVIAILGILAAVAVPVFLSQRQRAADVTVKNDLRLVAGTVEAMRAEGTALSEPALREDLRLSPGTVVSVFEGSGDYCLLGTKESGVTTTQAWTYRSGVGFGDSTATTCAGARLFDLS